MQIRKASHLLPPLDVPDFADFSPKIRLAIFESLDLEETGEFSPEWREEIFRQCREIDEGLVELISAGTVLARVYSAIKLSLPSTL